MELEQSWSQWEREMRMKGQREQAAKLATSWLSEIVEGPSGSVPNQIHGPDDYSPTS